MPQSSQDPARPSTDPPIRAGQAAFAVLSLLDHDKANALRGTDADPFYDDSKLPKFWESLGCAPASVVEEGAYAEGGWPATELKSLDDKLDRKVDPAGKPSPCHGIGKGCRAKGLDQGALAVRRLKTIETELKAGDIAHDRLEEVQDLAWQIVELVAAHPAEEIAS